MQSDESRIRAFDAVRALAFIGDLSMGQPTDHSLRTAWLGCQLAQVAGLDAEGRATVAEASLLRWSGCTANAAGFAQVMGDDIAGREAMLAQRSDWAEPLQRQGGVEAALTPLAQIHCEVSGEVARMLDLGDTTQATLRNIFEAWDGSGIPGHAQASAIPPPVFVVALAGDLEIFSRVYGLDAALVLIAQRADHRYPAELAALAARHAAAWLDALERLPEGELDGPLLTPRMKEPTSPELIADVIDLKLPWMTGFSRAVASTATACCARLSLDAQASEQVYLAGLVHGIGRTAVPNTTWNTPGKLSASAWEKLRLVPYWTSRAGKQTGALRQAAELASHGYERLDGSGYFRGVSHALTLEARILAASIAWVALRSARPWREAFSTVAAAAQLREEAANGRFDSHVVESLLSTDLLPASRRHRQASPIRLSARELDVLRLIGRGASNKEAARQLTLSPSTVRTHVESVFRKLECSTRATAVLKASAMGIM